MFSLELPYIAPTVGTVLTVAMTYAITNIDSLMTLTAGGPGRSTETLYYVVYKNSFLESKYGYGLAEGAVTATICIAIFMLTSLISNGKNMDGIEVETL